MMIDIPCRVVPVLVLNDVETGLKMCELLVENGLPVAEITFRTQAAPDVIAAAAERFPSLLLGAGTILNAADLARAIASGAKFAVAPGFNPAVVKAASERGFAFAPGICTPSEVEQALELGCRFFKFFPADAAGGTNMLKAIIAPYKHLGLKFMPTGGINARNAADYLAIPEVACVGGTWLGKNIPDWEQVAVAIREAATLSRENRE